MIHDGQKKQIENLINKSKSSKSLSMAQKLFHKSKTENLALREKIKNLSRISRMNHERIIVLKEKDKILD